ncbi:MAG: restriction endonuclease subunit S [Phycisphaerales bacterium]|nr:restriction endonuclease subunit S [Phycisphaerales bacterium]
MSFSGWNKYQLGDLVEVKGGKRLPKGKILQQEKTNHPYIRITDLNGRKIDKNNLLYVSDDIFQSISRYIVNTDDIILSIVGTIGLIAKIDSELNNASLTENCVKFIEPKGIEREFLFYYLTTTDCQNEIRSKTIGTTQPKLPIYNIKSLEINLPNLKTQQSIASILSSLDDAIELNQQINKTLEEMAKAIFKEWFVDFNFPNATGKFQETEIGKIPVGWKAGKLGDVCEVNKNTLNKKNDLLDWIDYIEISEVSKGLIGKVTRYNIGEEPSRAKRKLKHGDTVLSTVRPDRGSYFLAIEPKKTDIASTGFAVFSPLKVPFSFLHLFLTDEVSFKYYGQVANGGAYPAINPITIMEMDLIIPDDEILSDFHKIVEPFFIQIQQNIEENQSLINLRDTLLPKLMKGEIEIQEKETV